jgi:hypothetical protein
MDVREKLRKSNTCCCHFDHDDRWCCKKLHAEALAEIKRLEALLVEWIGRAAELQQQRNDAEDALEGPTEE